MDTLKIVLLVLVVILIIYLLSRNSKNEPFTSDDNEVGKKALLELEYILKTGQLPLEVSDEELEKLADSVYMVRTPETKEGMSYFPEENTRYWPQYYYSFPYNYKYGGAWPPGLYSRLYYWSPGYYTGTGWRYYMRPGIGYKYWPRNVWVRNTRGGKDSYYYLSNGGDYIHNAADYSYLRR